MSPFRFVFPFALASLALGQPATPRSAAAAEEEEQLIHLVASNAPAAERSAACLRLQRIGSERAVPALAALLANPELSHAARFALETLPSPVAGRALISAVATTAGPEQIGIVTTLGIRREAMAAPALARLLALAPRAAAGTATEADSFATALGVATATSLGAIDHPDALAALETTWDDCAPSLRDAVGDALLQHAQRRLEHGQRAEADRIAKKIRSLATLPAAHLAAFRILLQAAGDASLDPLVAAIAGPAGPEQSAALSLVPELPIAEARTAFASLLPRLQPTVQVALLNGWMERSDPPRLADIVPLLSSPAPEVRLAAIRALGRVGDETVVATLVAAAGTPGPEQRPARIALTQMNRGDIGGRLQALLADPRDHAQVEAARALGERGDKRAVPALLERARAASDAVRLAALRALTLLLNERQVAAIVQLIADAPNEARRSEAIRALVLTYDRLQPGEGSLALAPLLQNLVAGTPATRAALLAACCTIPTTEIRRALRRALVDDSPEIRSAALRALGQTIDPELLPDLIEIASSATDVEFRELATRACVRLTTAGRAKLSPAKRFEMLRTLAAGPTSPAQKRAVLAGLSDGRTLAELTLAQSLSADPAVSRESCAALLKIAPRVPQAAPALAALRQAQALTDDDATRREVETALKAVEARAGYVTSWQSAPPFRVRAEQTPALIAAAFAPEIAAADFRTAAARTRLAAWAPMPVGTEARNAMLMRGGQASFQGVAYAFTWVRSPCAQSARLELGHDQAVKVWLNSRLVFHATEAGNLPPKASAPVDIALETGWNHVLLKIAQPEKTWAFSLRLLQLDGSAFPDLEVNAEATPEP